MFPAEPFLLAYTLPGPEFLGQFAALAAWAGAAFVSALLYPVYTLVRWARGGKPQGSEDEEASADEAEG